MKALSINNPYAQLVVRGYKTLEVRSYKTKYRGDLLICASKRSIDWGMIDCKDILSNYSDIVTPLVYQDCGYAIGVVNLNYCRTMHRDDEINALFRYKEGLWVWELTNPRIIKPFPVKGNLGFFNVEHELEFL